MFKKKKFPIRVDTFSVYIIVTFALAEIFFRIKGIPIPLYDSSVYYVPGIVFSESGNLSHPFWGLNSDGSFNPNGGPFLWHGWTHSYINGIAGRVFSGGLTGVRISETIIVSAGCIIFSDIISKIRKNGSVIVHLSALLSTTAVSFSMFGRPESVAFLLLVIGVFVLQRLEKGPKRAGLIVVVWGGLGATQPTVALLVGPILLGYLILKNSSSLSALTKWMAIGAASVLVTFLLTIFVCPYSLTDWINGLLAHAKKTAGRTDTGGLLYYYFLQGELFMQGLTFLFSTFILLIIPWNIGKSKSWFILTLLFLFYLISWYTSVRLPATNYNLFALYPIFLIFMLCSIDVFSASYKKKVSSLLVILVGIFAILILGRRYVIFDRSLEGASREEVKSAVDELPEKSEISINQSLLIAAYSPHEYSRFDRKSARFEKFSKGDIGNESDYLVLRQARTERLTPPNIKGFKVVKETFDKNQIYFGPVKLSETDYSYNFAIYEKRD